MTIALIAALTKKHVIGKGLKIPWHIKEDFQKFKETTMGHPVIMGMKTYQSMGKALPGRKNIVLNWDVIELPDATVVTSMEDAIALGKKEDETVFIIGGGSIYRMGLPLADTMYLSWVKKDYEGDIFFPEFDEKEWEIVGEDDFEEFVFTKYVRKK